MVLQEFVGDCIPTYAILSHTWDFDEVMFSEMIKSKHRELAKRKYGFSKIARFCAQAQKDGYEWGWVDTCCIDKRSSAELSEAINSMFQWYQRSGRCYVYLFDVKSDMAMDTALGLHRCFVESRWFHRGFTLQELLAPQKVVFFARDWTPIREGSLVLHEDLAEAVSKTTEIPVDFLIGKKGLWQAPVAQRMFWASHRKTTREEDRAYSLMGMFDISMPILYGEGLEKAFTRLQHEILRRSTDQSILCWYHTGITSHRLLAESPDCFQNSGSVTPLREKPTAFGGVPTLSTFSMTNFGLRITVPILRVVVSDNFGFIPGERVEATLQCVLSQNVGSFRKICLNLLFFQKDTQGVSIFICHRVPRWGFGNGQGIPMDVLLCGNDYISNKLGGVRRNLASPDVLVSQIMEILAAELGSESHQLADTMVLSHLDPVKCIAISRTIHNRTGLEIDLQTFMECSTLGGFKAYAKQEASGLILHDFGDTQDLSQNDLCIKIRDIIADEMGVDAEDVVAADDLAALGMDSLMSLTVLGRLREETGLAVDVSLFALNCTLAEVQRALLLWEA